MEQENGINQDNYNRGYIEGAAEMGKRYRDVVLKLRETTGLMLALSVYEDTPQKTLEILNNTMAEVANLIEDSINHVKENQELRELYSQAIELIIDSCLSCPGGNFCNQKPEEKGNCRGVVARIIKGRIKG